MTSFLVITTSFLVITRSFLVKTTSFLVITTSFSRNNDMCRYNRYMVELRWASVRAAQSDINEDLHAAELKYTVWNVFNVMVLIIAACLLGLISNTTLYPITALRPMTCLGYIGSDQNSYFWIIDSGLGIFIYLNDWRLIEQQIEIWTITVKASSCRGLAMLREQHPFLVA